MTPITAITIARGTIYPSISVPSSRPDFLTLEPIEILPSDVSWKKSPYGFAESVAVVVFRKLSETEVSEGVVVLSVGIFGVIYRDSISKKNLSCKSSHEKSLAVYGFQVFILSLSVSLVTI
jgi:hypothetical protein